MANFIAVETKICPQVYLIQGEYGNILENFHPERQIYLFELKPGAGQPPYIENCAVMRLHWRHSFEEWGDLHDLVNLAIDKAKGEAAHNQALDELTRLSSQLIQVRDELIKRRSTTVLPDEQSTG